VIDLATRMRLKSIRFEVESTEGGDGERVQRLSRNGGLKYRGVSEIGNKSRT